MRPYILEECHWDRIKESDFQLAVLPWGATEPHNYHLPYGTDNYETRALVEEAARLAWEDGARVVVLPHIPMGVNTGQTDLYMTLNMQPGTQQAILEDVAESLEAHGVNRLLVANGHGGNDFRQILREVGHHFPGMLLAQCNWFQSVERSEFFRNGGDHADEMETSLMLYCRPELVRPLGEAGEGKAHGFSVKELNEPWAWSERKWSQVSRDTGIGDPRKATAEKGERYFREVTARLASLMRGLAVTPAEEFYRGE